MRPPTVGEFVQQFGGAYFATEGALWRTLKLLLFKPGELTRQYLAGRRKHYVLPLRLYLSISLVVLLAVRLLAGASLEAPGAVQVEDKELRSLNIDLGWGKAGMREGIFYCEGLPPWLCTRLKRRIDLAPEAFAGQIAQVGQRFVANLGATLFVLLPSFALGLKLLYWNRRLRYTEHLVFALHLHAAWFGVLGLTLLPWSWLELLWLAVPVYTVLAMKRVYGGRWWPRWLRASLISVLYGALFTLGATALGVWSFLA